MKISTKRLKEIIQEELANDDDDDVIILLERDVGPSVYPAFKAVRDLYNEATTNEAKKKIEDDIIYVINNIIDSWRLERKNTKNPEV